jgi:hypothetical protein
MRRTKITRTAASGLLFVAMSLAPPANATTPLLAGGHFAVLAQAMIPPSGMMDAQHPMPMNERYLRRFPQPARVGDLIGLPVLDLNSTTLGNVRRSCEPPVRASDPTLGRKNLCHIIFSEAMLVIGGCLSSNVERAMAVSLGKLL